MGAEWDDSDHDVPTGMRETFGQIKDIGIDYAMWVCLTVVEREAVYTYLSMEEEDRYVLEREICNDKAKPKTDRSKCESTIRKALAMIAEAAPAAGTVVSNANTNVIKSSYGAVSSYDDTYPYTSNYDSNFGTNYGSSSGAVIPAGGVTDHTPPVVRTRLAHKFTGLVNQSSTCYLSALLQSLYHLPVFRKAIYSLRPGTDADGEPIKPESSIPLALQQLFSSLEAKKRTKTVTLTQAFGWNAAEAAVQHDTHELVRKLFDVLEHQFNKQNEADHGTSDRDLNPIKKLFCGERLYFSKCLDVDYTSTRVEELYDIELVVKGNASIEESLKAETTAERLDGSNKYCWEHDDEPVDPETKKVRKTYHEADRGVAYRELPPVLMMHPNRLDFCMRTFQRVTVDSKWTFGQELDMEPYIESAPNAPAKHVAEAAQAKEREEAAAAAKAAQRTGGEDDDAPVEKQETEQPVVDDADDKKADDDAATQPDSAAQAATTSSGRHTYKLRSVTIHSGAATFGHYYCYVNFDGAWVKFNDETVTDVNAADVWRDAFGGTTVNQWGYSSSSNTRAGLLMYVREDAAEECLAELTDADVPMHIRELETREAARAAEAKKKVDEEAKLASVPVILCDAAGDYVKHMREIRKAPVRKLDPALSLAEADPEFADCSFWAIGTYFAHSHQSYRGSTQSAMHMAGSELVSRFWTAGTSYPIKALIVVPHSVCPPPADGTVPCMVTAFAGVPSVGLEFKGVYTSIEQLKDAFEQLRGSATTPAADGAVTVTATTTAVLEAKKADIDDDDDNIFIPDTAPNAVDGGEWDGVTRAVKKASTGSDDGDSVVAGGAGSSPRSTPGFAPEADGSAVNPLYDTYADEAGSKLDDTQGSTSTAVAHVDPSPSAAAPAPAPAVTATADPPRLLIEAGNVAKEYTVDEVVSGDVVVVPSASADSATTTDDDSIAAAMRAHQFEHHSCDVTLYRLPGSYDTGAAVDADAVTPVTGVSDDATVSRFPTSDSATEVGQIRLIESDTFDQLQDAVASYIGTGVDPRTIAFRGHSSSADAPNKNLAERSYKGYYDTAPKQRTVKEILSGTVGQYMICKLYFEILPMPFIDFENKGLREYVAIDGPTKRHFWAAKPATAYMYSGDTKKLRTEACRKLGVPVGRVAFVNNDYYGSLQDVVAEPLFVDPADSVQTAATAITAPTTSQALAETATTNDENADPAAASSTAPNSNTGAEVDTDKGDGADDVLPPLEKPAAAKAVTKRTDIVVPYPAPTSGNHVDSSHLVILPDLPPPVNGRVPPVPAEQVPGVVTVAPNERYDDDAERPMRWMLIGLQHATRRSRDDIFGFGTCLYVCESDTGADLRRRVLEHLGATEETAEKWSLLYMKTCSGTPFLVAKDTRAIDLLPFDARPTGASSYYSYSRFSGSLVIERPMPPGAKKHGGKRSGTSNNVAEPELRIHATGAALAGASADATSTK